MSGPQTVTTPGPILTFKQHDFLKKKTNSNKEQSIGSELIRKQETLE